MRRPRGGSRVSREALILENLYLIAPIARRIQKQLPDHTCELDDLTQAGTLGLIQAADTWQPGKSPFSFWARLKIRCSIIEMVRGDAFEYAKRCGHMPNLAAHINGEAADLIAARRPSIRELAAPESSEPEETIPPELLLALHRAISSLEAKKRKLVDLVYNSEKSVKQALRIVGRSGELGIGWRRTEREHKELLEQLAELLKDHGAA